MPHDTAAVHRLRRGEGSPPYEAAQVHKGDQRFVVSMRISRIGSQAGGADGISLIARGIPSPGRPAPSPATRDEP